MGKIFNDQIVKILCAKNLTNCAANEEQGEPALQPVEKPISPQPTSKLRRGESYVVFINKHSRKELQRAISSLERDFNASAPNAICSTWPSSTLRPWAEQSHALGIRASLSSSISSFKNLLHRSFSNRLRHGELNQDSVACIGRTPKMARALVTPALFGPFVDEGLCASFDRVYYCFCLMFGYELEPVQLPLANSTTEVESTSDSTTTTDPN